MPHFVLIKNRSEKRSRRRVASFPACEGHRLDRATYGRAGGRAVGRAGETLTLSPTLERSQPAETSARETGTQLDYQGAFTNLTVSFNWRDI